MEESQNKKCSFLTGLVGVTDPEDPGHAGGDTEPPLPGVTKPPDTEPCLPDEELDPLNPEPGELGGEGEMEPTKLCH